MITSIVKLSVVVTAYESARYLDRCLLSIRASSFSDFELIVVDDGSKDSTSKIARQHADRVIVHQKNRGRNQSRIDGYKAASSDYVINIDSDIVIAKDALEVAYTFLSQNKHIDLITNIYRISSDVKGALTLYKMTSLNHLYKKLPEDSTLVYGGFFGMKKELSDLIVSECKYSDDTDFAFNVLLNNNKVHHLDTVDFEHLKKYSVKTFSNETIEMGADWVKIVNKNLKLNRFIIGKQYLRSHLFNHFLKPFSYYYFLFTHYKVTQALMISMSALFESCLLVVGILKGALYCLYLRGVALLKFLLFLPFTIKLGRKLVSRG